MWKKQTLFLKHKYSRYFVYINNRWSCCKLIAKTNCYIIPRTSAQLASYLSGDPKELTLKIPPLKNWSHDEKTKVRANLRIRLESRKKTLSFLLRQCTCFYEGRYFSIHKSYLNKQEKSLVHFLHVGSTHYTKFWRGILKKTGTTLARCVQFIGPWPLNRPAVLRLFSLSLHWLSSGTWKKPFRCHTYLYIV